MADDHSSAAIGAYKSRLKDYLLTPNIDKLAKEGAVFLNALCTNALCSPSRATIMTGKYSHKSGVYTLRETLNTANIPTLPKLFHDHGYQTAVVGKWHIEGDNLYGFDHYAISHGQGSYVNPSYDSEKGKVKFTGHSTEIITGMALDWLKSREQGKPFILFTHYKAAHGPWQYNDKFESLYKNQDIPEPQNLFDSYANRNSAGAPMNQARIHEPESKMSLSYWFQSNKKGKKGTWPTGTLDLSGKTDKEKTSLTYQKYIRDYMRCVAGIDEGVGSLLDYLEETGELDNTMVIYTSDQGMYLGEHNFFDKRLGLDEAMKIPFIVRYPRRVKSGTVIDEIVNNVDISSTLLDFAAIQIPDEMQGISFLPLLEGEHPDTIRRASFYAFYSNGSPKHFGIRTKEYKLLKYVDKNGNVAGSDLFNVVQDPKEMKSLYDEPGYFQVRKKMEQLLQEEMLKVGIDKDHLPGKLEKADEQ